MTNPSTAFRTTALVLAIAFATDLATAGSTSRRCGKGFVEQVNGCTVLHLKGTPYEMGYQHGALLKANVKESFAALQELSRRIRLPQFGYEFTPTNVIALIIDIQTKYLPAGYREEIQGLADGAGISEELAFRMNFIPELFHCSGFAIMNSATRGGTLYHGRVLDYATDWGLQKHGVLIVSEPDGKIPFVNVSFAGFVGSVTGMNAEHISIGEMGGHGLGQWNGVPMAALVRRALEESKSVDDAVAIFRDSSRTCEYYYVVADGKSNEAVGMEASANKFAVLKPGEFHPMLPSPIQDCVIMSADRRYRKLVSWVKGGHGDFDEKSALELMNCPVAMKRQNLHNVLFEPKSTRFWYSLASEDRKPAASQPYQAFQLTELLKRRPPEGVEEIALRK
ncbi:MAG: C45 family autoproteolytic acyltransferase/hydrolase [Planctomycetota bacterium]|nr:C45 family autoproteolytic acyltransferase/hydrolase [Planctomycetota bacterium]MDA1137542.1 C45 family autoproteolytic acyltransferase/hydrolase [Planctomycetota bacterium]